MKAKLHGVLLPEQNDSGLLELTSLTISAPATDLRRLASFLNACADDIDQNGPSYTHRHLRDEAATTQLPDIKVSRCV